MRWRTEREVFDGKGQFCCGNKACSSDENLESFELHFAYEEHGEHKQCLVKLRVCPACAKKLNYRSEKDARREERRRRKRERKERKHARRRGEARSRSRSRSRSGSDSRSRERDAHGHDRHPKTQGGASRAVSAPAAPPHQAMTTTSAASSDDALFARYCDELLR